ncbi:hypothetical protein Zmor_017956 [Zophobas morio]|uniref:Protein MIS12 homolog n=1 Tax=Zophobas morio TaxID=2755281 RepID=A0AA38MD23_9CUCU|nr:hypothetical protein Zmor_017956 [Zophobas morio]
MAEAEEYIQDEQELYHFHFNWKQLYEDFLELNISMMYDSVQLLQDMLLSKFPEDVDEIKTQITKLMDMYITNSREPLEKFRETVKQIFTLPPNVVLPGLTEEKMVTTQEFQQLKVEVDKLEQQLIEEVYYKAQLKKEMKKFEHIQPLSEKVDEILNFYENNKPKPGTKAVEELFEALKTCEKFYYSKRCNDEDKSDVQDDFGLFTEYS